MLKINCVNLKNDINKLNSLIDEYEEIKLNLFNQLKDACINWQDGNSQEFDSKIYLEKVETNLILQSLKDKQSLFKFVYDKYSDIGSKIVCDLKNKTSVFSMVDSCLSQIDNILYEFNLIDGSFYYYEYQSIIRQKNKVLDCRNKLNQVRNNVSSMYTRIEQIEREVNDKIKMLSEVKINSFDYNLV